MMKKLSCAAAAMLLCLTASLGAKPKIPEQKKASYAPLDLNDTEGLARSIGSYVAEREAGLASVAVAVFSNGKTVYENYFGYADIDRQLAASSQTVYEWGSTSKLLVWASVMQLWEQGKIDLDRDIRDYLPPDFAAKLRYRKPVTMTQLMNHKGGFQECIYEDPDAGESDIRPLGETVLAFEPQQVYEPGKVTAYSNWGTALAAYVVECISGQDYAAYVRQHILEPLGMEHTAVSARHDDNAWAKQQREKLQTYSIDSERRQDLGTCVAYVELYPAGAAISTLGDYLTFAKALSRSDEELPLFKDAATMQLFHSATSCYGDTELPKNCHGLWCMYYGTRLLGHGGNTYGCSSNLVFDPESASGIVVLTNECGESTFTYGLAELVFGSMPDAAQGAGSASPDISGFYTSSRTVKKGALRMAQYTLFMPIFRSKEPGSFRLPSGGSVRYAGQNRYVMDNGNGMAVMMYLSRNTRGQPVLEMETCDYIRDPFFVPIFAMIVLMALLAAACVIVLLVKGIRRLALRRKAGSAPHRSGSLPASAQLFVPPVIVCMVIAIVLFGGAMVKPFAIVSALLAGLVALSCAANALYLLKEKRWFAACTGLFCVFFIVFFQFCDFWSF